MTENEKHKHFVLVHGGCHGAWCWYKVKPRLEAAGHRVTVMDLTAVGINMNRVEDIQTLQDYTRPLLEILSSLGSEQKAVLVAHSLGGPSAALAMDMFPQKISVSVFLTSFMPDTINPPSYVMDKLFGSIPQEIWLDSQFTTYGDSGRPLMSVLLGPKYLSTYMYQLSPVEDLELAKTLVRIGPLISSHLAGASNFTNEGYGSVTRVYIVCSEDEAIPEEYQRWMIRNYPVKEVMEIEGADHMAIFSKPQEVCDCLTKIANRYG